MQAATLNQDAECAGKTCSIGLIRHKAVIAGCIGLVGLLTLASTVDLASLTTFEGKLDQKLNFERSAKAPDLKPNQSRANDDYSNSRQGSEGLYPFKEGYFGRDVTYGWMDENGTVVIKPQKFVSVEDFHRGMARVRVTTDRGDRWGFIDRTGAMIVKPVFNEATDFNREGVAVVSLENSLNNEQHIHQLIDRSGKVLASFPGTKKVEYLNNGAYAVEEYAYDLVGLVDSTGKELTPRIYSKIGTYETNSGYYYRYNPCFDRPINFSSNWFIIELAGKKGAIDSKGKILVKPEYDGIRSVSNGHAVVEKDHSNLIIDADGKIAIPGKFNYATEYADLIAVSDINGARFIDSSGKQVNSPYKFVGPDNFGMWFNEGLAPVCDAQGHFGYIDKTGKTIIAPKFEAAFPFKDGHALVYDGKFWSFIDKTGENSTHLDIVRLNFGESRSNDDDRIAVTVAGPLYEYLKAARTREETKSTIDGWKRNAGIDLDKKK